MNCSEGMFEMLIKMKPDMLEIRKPSMTANQSFLLNRKLNTLPSKVEIRETEDAFELSGEPQDLYTCIYRLTRDFDLEIM